MTTSQSQRPTLWVAMSVAVGITALACSRSGVEVQRLPNGARELQCQEPLEQCLRYVDDLCKGGSYEVLYAKDERKLFGSEQSQIEGHTSLAQVHCLGPHAAPLPEASATPPSGAPKRAVTAPPVTSTTAPPTKPERACVPGTTQSCVGPGACTGGQACLLDGSGFAPCDCGGGGATRAVP